jgi:two-component system response regulator RegX3
MHIGIAEDDPDQLDLLRLWLEGPGHGHSVRGFGTTAEYIAALKKERFDLLMIDWVLPDGTGADLLAWVRGNLGWDIPVLVVTARDDEATVVAALQAGAEKEFDLTVYLFQSPGKLLSRDHLLNKIWGINAEVDTRTVDTHVSRLRKKLGLDGSRGWKLVPVYGVGYRFERLDGAPAAPATPA